MQMPYEKLIMTELKDKNKKIKKNSNQRFSLSFKSYLQSKFIWTSASNRYSIVRTYLSSNIDREDQNSKGLLHVEQLLQRQPLHLKPIAPQT